VATPPFDLAALTAQERACLALVAQRLSSKEIALRLGIAKTSVDTYCNRARHKLGVSDRYAAARLLTASLQPQPILPEPAAARPLRAGRLLLGLVAGAAAAVVGIAALLAGMAALEALKPPSQLEEAQAEAEVQPTSPLTAEP